jgi:hypothetical protein
MTEIKEAEDLNVLKSKQEANLKELREAAAIPNSGVTPRARQRIPQMENDLAYTSVKLESLKDKLEKDVNQAIESRHATFDAILIRLMECQVEFFTSAASVLENLTPSIQEYREKNSVYTAPASPAKVDLLSNIPEKPSIEIELKEEIMQAKFEGLDSRIPSPCVDESTPPIIPELKPEVLSVDDILGLDFGLRPRAESQKVTKTQPPKVVEDLFDVLFFSSPEVTVFSQVESEPLISPLKMPEFQFKNQGDILDILGDFAAPVSKPAPEKPVKQAEKKPMDKQTTVRELKPKVVSKIRSKSVVTASKAKVPDKDLLEVKDIGEAAKPRGWTDDDGHVIPPDSEHEEHKELKASITVVLNEEQALQAQQNARDAVNSFRDKEAAATKLEEEKREVSLKLDVKLSEWEFKGGVRKNIRTLLTSVHQVLWEGAGVDPIPMSALMNEAGLKKAKAKLFLKVAPDRVKFGSVDQMVIADRVFNAINTQYSVHLEGKIN